MTDASRPAAAGVLFPELLGTPEPAPPVRPRGGRALRMLARFLLWALIAAGALRGLVPAPARPAPVAGVEPSADQRGAAVAAAFLREYLTLGDDRAARAERLRRFTAAGVDLDRSASVPAGVAQYVDQVVAAGTTPDAAGIEVAVLAHVLQLRSGVYRDGGTLAFVVPLAVRRQGFAVRGPPRPRALPIAAGLSLPRPPAVPTAISRSAGRTARQAVVAFVARDLPTLVRLGGGRAPATHPLPSGWRVIAVGHAEVSGRPAASTVEVAVRARPPEGVATYVIPVRVQLVAGPRGPTVRQIDAGPT